MIILNILSNFASPSDLDLKEIQIKNTADTDIRKRSATVGIKNGRTKGRIFALVNDLDFNLHVRNDGTVDGAQTTHTTVNGKRVCRNSTLFTVYELSGTGHRDVLIRSHAHDLRFPFICMDETGNLQTKPLYKKKWLSRDCVWENENNFERYSHRFFPRTPKENKRTQKWYLAIDKNGNGVIGNQTYRPTKESRWKLSDACDKPVNKFIHVEVIINGAKRSASPVIMMSAECQELKNVIQNEIRQDHVFSEEVKRSLDDIEERLVDLFNVFRAEPEEIERFRKLFRQWVKMHWTLKLVRMKIARIRKKKKKKEQLLKRSRSRNMKPKYRKAIKKANSRLAQRLKVLRKRKRQWNRLQHQLTVMLQSVSMSGPKTEGRTRLHDFISSIVQVKMYSIAKIRLAVYLQNLRERFKNDTEHLEAVKFRQLRRRMRIIRIERKKSAKRRSFATYFRNRRDLEPSRPFSENFIRNWAKYSSSLRCVRKWTYMLKSKKKKNR